MKIRWMARVVRWVRERVAVFERARDLDAF